MFYVKTSLIPREIAVGHFTDGTLKIKCPISRLAGKKLDTHIIWHYEKEEELSTLIQLTLHLRDHGVQDIILDMPYLPNARQDRVQSEEEVFTLKHFAKVINWLNFTCVNVLDVHSRVSLALFDRIVNRSPQPYIDEAMKRIGTNVATFFPDEGAMKRYSKSHEYPAAFGMKTRNPETNKVESLVLAGDTSHIKGNDVLIIDDICGKGETALRCAKALKNAGANKVYLFVSHCENTVIGSELLESDLVEHVFTTPGLFNQIHKKITVIA